MNYSTIISATGALVVGNCLFFGTYLLTINKRSLSNTYLGLLLVALAIRISKSIIIIVFPDSSNIFSAIGLVGMACIGPFLFLYIQSFSDEKVSVTSMVHLIPATILTVLIPFVGEQTTYLFYQIIVFQILVYLVLSVVHQRKYVRSQIEDQMIISWNNGLLAGVAAIWTAFLIQLLFDYYISYVVATSVAAIVLYVLGFWAMTRRKLFTQNRKKLNGNIKLEHIAQQVLDLFENQKIYKNFDLTPQKIAKKLELPPYLVLQAINNNLQRSYPALLNHYRIEEVKSRLCNGDKNHLSIETIAFESGFASPSSFYATFKKMTGVTPGEFREHH